MALINFAKQRLGLSHYIAHCDAENIGSYRVMEKLGMVRTGEYGGRKNKASDDERREYRYELIGNTREASIKRLNGFTI